jgi:hypothetical protein
MPARVDLHARRHVEIHAGIVRLLVCGAPRLLGVDRCTRSLAGAAADRSGTGLAPVTGMMSSSKLLLLVISTGMGCTTDDGAPRQTITANDVAPAPTIARTGFAGPRSAPEGERGVTIDLTEPDASWVLDGTQGPIDLTRINVQTPGGMTNAEALLGVGGILDGNVVVVSGRPQASSEQRCQRFCREAGHGPVLCGDACVIYCAARPQGIWGGGSCP